jgi:hypothetical protein
MTYIHYWDWKYLNKIFKEKNYAEKKIKCLYEGKRKSKKGK